MNGVEKQILRKVAETLINKGYVLSLCDGEEEISFISLDHLTEWADNLDECWLITTIKEDVPSSTFVFFIWGNGAGGRHCISDYGFSLDPLISPIMDWADKAEAQLLEE